MIHDEMKLYLVAACAFVTAEKLPTQQNISVHNSGNHRLVNGRGVTGVHVLGDGVTVFRKRHLKVRYSFPEAMDASVVA